MQTKKYGWRFFRLQNAWKQRFTCVACKHVWFYQKHKDHKVSKADKVICRESIERGSMRILARRFDLSKTRVMQIVHAVTRVVKDSIWIAQQLPLQWSGILVFDGVHIRIYDKLTKNFDLSKLTDVEKRYLHKKVWLCGIDYGTGDLPHYDLGDEETMIDMVTYFNTLKMMGYPLNVLVSDGNTDIIRAARHVYGDHLLHQLCTRHFIEGLRSKVGNDALSTDPKLGGLIDLVQQIIEAETIEASYARYEALARIRPKGELQKLVISTFHHHKNELTTHLQYSELSLPHTTNDIENLFKQLRLRTRSLGSFRDFYHARHYLKAWALWRRTTKFTDCKGARKTRNGRSPLQLACRTKPVDIDFLSL